MKRIGIFSGTFDPVHDGHISFAKQAVRQGELDKVFFLVEPRPRRKQGVKALEHRIEMVKLAIAKEPQLGLIILEQARFNVAETLPLLEARFQGAELYMLLGEDVLGHLAHWPQVERLTASVMFVIGIRKLSKSDIGQRVKTIETVRGVTIRYQTFRSSHNDYASSSLRLQIKRGQQPAGLDPAVYRYIQAVGLYASAEA